MKTLGSRIRFARGTLSQEVFAARIGVSKGSLGGYERDENLPSTDVALRICQEAGVSVQWLLLGADVSPVHEKDLGVPRNILIAGALPSPNVMGVAQAPRDGDVISFASDGKVIQKDCARCHRLEQRLERMEDERRELNEENRRLWKENSLLNARLARMKTRCQRRSFEAVFLTCAGCAFFFTPTRAFAMFLSLAGALTPWPPVLLINKKNLGHGRALGCFA